MRLAVSLCVLATALSVFSSRGTEEVIPFYRQTQVAELRSPLDAVNLEAFPEPHGIRLGNLRIDPYATEDSTYTDNPTRSEHNKKDDVLDEYAVGFNAKFRPQECVKFTLDYEFGWHEYEFKTAKNYLSHRAGFNAALNHLGVQGLSLNFSEQYLQTANSSALENEIAQFQRYQSDQAAMRATYAFNRFKVSGEYSYSLLDYMSQGPAFQNFRTHTGNLESSWQWLPSRLEIFESFQLQRTLYDHQGDIDFDGYLTSAGVRGTYSKLTYSFAAGYAFATPLYFPGVKGDVGFNGSLSYTPTKRIGFDLVASRGFVPDVRTGETLETDLNAALKFVLTRRGKLALNYTRNEAERINGVQQISVAYSTRFDYKITRNASAIFAITRYDRSSTLINDSFNANEVRLGFKLAW